jgi:hypothetical protein
MFSPSFVPRHRYSPSYIRPIASLTARFAVFFANLYCSKLSTLLCRCICLKHSFFSLIVFCTFSSHHHVSLASRLPCLATLSSYEATFLMQVAIFIYILFASPPSYQELSLRTLSWKVCVERTNFDDLSCFTGQIRRTYHFHCHLKVCRQG